MCSFNSSQQFLHCGAHSSIFALFREHCNQPPQLLQCGIVHTRVAHAFGQIAVTMHCYIANFFIVESIRLASVQHGPQHVHSCCFHFSVGMEEVTFLSIAAPAQKTQSCRLGAVSTIGQFSTLIEGRRGMCAEPHEPVPEPPKCRASARLRFPGERSHTDRPAGAGFRHRWRSAGSCQ